MIYSFVDRSPGLSIICYQVYACLYLGRCLNTKCLEKLSRILPTLLLFWWGYKNKEKVLYCFHKISSINLGEFTFLNNARMNNRTNLNLGEVVCISINFHNPASWVNLLDGYDFIFDGVTLQTSHFAREATFDSDQSNELSFHVWS